MYFIWNDDRIIEHSLQLLWWHGLVWLGSAPTLQPRTVPWNPYVRYCERAVACMRSLTFFLWGRKNDDDTGCRASNELICLVVLEVRNGFRAILQYDEYVSNMRFRLAAPVGDKCLADCERLVSVPNNTMRKLTFLSVTVRRREVKELDDVLLELRHDKHASAWSSIVRWRAVRLLDLREIIDESLHM